MAIKGIKMAHPSQVREVGPGEVDRLLTQGWCEIKKPVSRKALEHRRLRQRFKLAGLKRLAVYLPHASFDELAAAKKPGETFAQLLIRLLHSCDEKP